MSPKTVISTTLAILAIVLGVFAYAQFGNKSSSSLASLSSGSTSSSSLSSSKSSTVPTNSQPSQAPVASVQGSSVVSAVAISSQSTTIAPIKNQVITDISLDRKSCIDQDYEYTNKFLDGYCNIIDNNSKNILASIKINGTAKFGEKFPDSQIVISEYAGYGVGHIRAYKYYYLSAKAELILDIVNWWHDLGSTSICTARINDLDSFECLDKTKTPPEKIVEFQKNQKLYQQYIKPYINN